MTMWMLHNIYNKRYFSELEEKFGKNEMLDSYNLRSYFKAGMKVLDVGCGSGDVSIELLRQECFVYGIDISADAIKVAKSKAAKLPRKLVRMAKFKTFKKRFDFVDDFFDVVIIFGVINHVTKLQASKIIRESRRVLKRGGTMITSLCGNKWHNDLRHFIWLYERLAGRPRMPIERYSDYGHTNFISPPEYALLLDGFRNRIFAGFNPKIPKRQLGALHRIIELTPLKWFFCGFVYAVSVKAPYGAFRCESCGGLSPLNEKECAICDWDRRGRP